MSEIIAQEDVATDHGTYRVSVALDDSAGDSPRDWANGEVYGFVIEKSDGEGRWEEVDSLWGMYGVDYAMSEGKAAIPAE